MVSKSESVNVNKNKAESGYRKVGLRGDWSDGTTAGTNPTFGRKREGKEEKERRKKKNRGCEERKKENITIIRVSHGIRYEVPGEWRRVAERARRGREDIK